MALKLLQPGIEPLGQFDMEDDDIADVTGGEVGVFVDLDEESDAYAADVFQVGPQTHITLGSAVAGQVYGLIDEGTSGYGTLFGTVIGTTVGQGTGFGTMSGTGVIVVGPTTMSGSGKATLWTKPGLYGVTVEAWTSETQFDLALVNTKVYGLSTGKLTTVATGVQVCSSLGHVTDTSLVSTTTTAAGAVAGKDEYAVVYLLGVSA